MQTGLNYASNWYDKANHTVMRVTIEFSRDAKYLGKVLDDKVLWNSQIKRVKDRAIKALMPYRGVSGLRWTKLRWNYTMVVRPMMTNSSIVLWHKADQTTTAAEL
jgi:hypothetical protein